MKKLTEKTTSKAVTKPANQPKSQQGEQDPIKAILGLRIDLLTQVMRELAGCYLYLEAPKSFFKKLTPEESKRDQLLDTQIRMEKEIDKMLQEVDKFYMDSKPGSGIGFMPSEKAHDKENLKIFIGQCYHLINEFRTIVKADNNALLGIERAYFNLLKTSYWLVGYHGTKIEERYMKNKAAEKKSIKRSNTKEKVRKLLSEEFNNQDTPVFYAEAMKKLRRKDTRSIKTMVKEIRGEL